VGQLPPVCITRLSSQDSQQQRTRGLNTVSQHQHLAVHTNIRVVSWLATYTCVSTIQMHFLKLFLISKCSYLTYLFWCLVDPKYSLGLSFTAPLYWLEMFVRICHTEDGLGMRIYDARKLNVQKWRAACTSLSECNLYQHCLNILIQEQRMGHRFFSPTRVN
jgi:hypothetical protein